MKSLRIVTIATGAGLCLLHIACGPCSTGTAEARKQCEVDRAQSGGASSGAGSGGKGSDPASSGGDPTNGTGGTGDSETADNLPTSCKDLGILEDDKAVSGWLKFYFDSNDDTVDYFCFEVPEPNISTVTLALNVFSGTIFAYAPALKEEDAIPPADSAANSWDLLPGEYALRISRGPGTDDGTEYDGSLLRTDLGFSEPDVDPGDEPADAVNVEVEEDPSDLAGYVGFLDSVDLYRLDVPSGRTVDVSLSVEGVSGPVTITAAPYSAVAPVFGDVLLSARPTDGRKQGSALITAGDQIVRVSGFGAYQIDMALTPTPENLGGSGSE